jgi:diadenosine tetraphosphate (Ap4A) HIT family hydrolase
MRKISKKQNNINKELKKVYKEIELERGHYCSGCGRSDVPLSHSHLIPRSRRPDLITDKRNITYHCLSMGERTGCHDIWEGIKRDRLLDYPKNMEYILEVDPEYYFLISE